MLFALLMLLCGFLYGYILNGVLVSRTRGVPLRYAFAAAPCCDESLKPSLPIISAFFLRLRCPHCNSYLPARNAILQWLNALLFFEASFVFGYTLHTGTVIVLFALLVAAGSFDIALRIVPNVLVTAGAVLGLCANGFFNAICSITDALLGILAGAGPLILVALLGYVITKKQSMGGGDIKLMGMVGVFLGWKLTILALILGAITGGIVAALLLTLRKIKKGGYLPFAPMLALGAVTAALCGVPMLNWYLGLFML